MTRGTVGLVGAGAVGPAIVSLLREAGWAVGTLASRTLQSARAAVRFVGTGRASDRNPDAAEGADLLLLGVPDRAIATVAADLARSGRVAPGTLVLHFSGALSSDVLAPLRAAGAETGSLHPLMSFAGAASAAERMATAWIFCEGEAPERIEAVAADLSPHVVRVAAESKVLYHAGAAAACNLLVAMVDLGVSLMVAAGIAREDAFAALLPLVAGTARNLEEVGLPAALTGPVARGDVDTVRAHLDAIGAQAPELLSAYREASRHAVEIGIGKGTLSEGAAVEIRRALDDAIPDRG